MQQPFIGNTMVNLPPLIPPKSKEELAWNLTHEVETYFLNASSENELKLNRAFELLKRATKIDSNPVLNSAAELLVVPLDSLKALELSCVYEGEKYFEAYFTALAHIMQAAKEAVTPEQIETYKHDEYIQKLVHLKRPSMVFTHDAPLEAFFYVPEQTQAMVEEINHHLCLLGVATHLLEQKLGYSPDNGDLREMYR